MTSYRLMDGAGGRPGNGPSTVASYGGDFLAGLCVSVTGQMMWFEGYWWWVCPAGQSTAPQKFALWNHYGSSSNGLVPGSVVTSGTLTAGQWNYVPLATPVQLAPGTQYVPCTGWQTNTGSGTGFPATNDQFGSGQPYAAGIVNGPLTAWSDATNGGTNNFPGTYAMAQGLFGVAGTDPSATMPAGGSNSANFWIDCQVSDTAPDGYSGSYRLWPNMTDALGMTPDTDNVFDLAMQFALSQGCTLDNIWFYSQAGYSQLPTQAEIWDVTAQTTVTVNMSPTWTLPGGGAAAAGDGWMYTPMLGSVALASGVNYKVAVYNGAATTIWNSSTASYWTTGFGASGLASGPVFAPDNAGATSPGQSSYRLGPPDGYPDQNAGPYNYWVDVEVTPQADVPVSGSETGSGADAGTVSASLPGSDTGTGAEGTPSAGLTSPDSGAGADAGTLAATLGAADAGSGTDAAGLGLAGTDTAAGADAVSLAVLATGADSGTGEDAGSASAALSGSDTASGADSASVSVPGEAPPLRASLLGGTAANTNTYGGSAS